MWKQEAQSFVLSAVWHRWMLDLIFSSMESAVNFRINETLLTFVKLTTFPPGSHGQTLAAKFKSLEFIFLKIVQNELLGILSLQWLAQSLYPLVSHPLRNLLMQQYTTSAIKASRQYLKLSELLLNVCVCTSIKTKLDFKI